MQYIASLSYGKDSMAMLEVIKRYNMPMDRIVHVEIMATDTIPADLPPMMKFKAKADKIIKDRYGIEVENFRLEHNFQECFYMKRGRTGRKSKFAGKLYGWPMVRGQWCLQQLKLPALMTAAKQSSGSVIEYIGIAADEPKRFHNLSERKRSPLVEHGITEAECRQICEELDLLSPIYNQTTRGGCWFCHNQSVGQLRLLRKQYPEYWALMLKWDKDSPVTFKADGHTVHDFDERFQMEDDGLLYPDDKIFRWDMLKQDINYRWF
jgi:3'-phosphoadenosine 5'-phosphosulfate sulfotransferase (PAPS reductase)/FAD synthetase